VEVLGLWLLFNTWLAWACEEERVCVAGVLLVA